MFCNNCGNKVTNGAMFCSKCGTSLYAKAADPLVSKLDVLPGMVEDHDQKFNVEHTKDLDKNTIKKTTQEFSKTELTEADFKKKTFSEIGAPATINDPKLESLPQESQVQQSEPRPQVRSSTQSEPGRETSNVRGKDMTMFGKVLAVLGVLLATVIIIILLINIFRFAFSSLFSFVLVIIAVAIGYIVYHKWIAMYITRHKYVKESNVLQLPEGSTPETLLQSLSGKFNYPYFKDARYGEHGECIIEGKYSEYSVLFTESGQASLVCVYEDKDKKARTIMLEAIAIRHYIDKFFNPSLDFNPAKYYKSLKTAEKQRKLVATVLSKLRGDTSIEKPFENAEDEKLSVCTLSGSVVLSDEVLRIKGFKFERRLDASFGSTNRRQELALPDIKSITMRRRNTWPLLLLSLFLIFTSIFSLFVTNSLSRGFYDLESNLMGIMFFIVMPLAGIFLMYQYMINLNGYRIIITHTGGSTEVFIRRSEISAAQVLIHECSVKQTDSGNKRTTVTTSAVTQKSDNHAATAFLTKKERLVMCLMGPFIMIPFITVFMIIEGDVDIGAPWIIASAISIVIDVILVFVIKDMMKKRDEKNRSGDDDIRPKQ